MSTAFRDDYSGRSLTRINAEALLTQNAHGGYLSQLMKRQDALDYHSQGRPGKIAVVPTKPLANQRDLGLAYSPGVAEPCLEIKNNPEDAYRYTAKGNLVAVVTNGTAVLGLGNIGALAGKPVMEGKGNLFKQFADIDVFDLEVGSEDPLDMIKFCQLLEPTVGGINLEDIRSPDCFLVEETLRQTMKIPVFHDDQHGTAIITGAALVNAMEVTGKDISKLKVVFSGAGAAGGSSRGVAERSAREILPQKTQTTATTLRADSVLSVFSVHKSAGRQKRSRILPEYTPNQR